MKFVCEICTTLTETSNYRGWLMHLSTSPHQKNLKFAKVNLRANNPVDSQNTYVLTGFTKSLLPRERMALLEHMSKYGTVMEFFHDIKYLFCYFTFVSGSGALDILKERFYCGTEIRVRAKSNLTRQDWDQIYDSGRQLFEQSQSGGDTFVTSSNSHQQSGGSGSTSGNGKGSRVFTPRPLRGRGGASGSGHFGANSYSSSRPDLTEESSDVGIKVSNQHSSSHHSKPKNKVHGERPPLQNKGQKNAFTPIDRSACSKDISDEIVGKTGVEQLTGELSDVANPLQSTPSTGQSLDLVTTEKGKTCQSEPSPPAVILEVTQSVPQTAFTPDEGKVLETTEDMEAREEEGEVNLEADEPSSKSDLEQLPGEDCTQILDGEKDQTCDDDGKAEPPTPPCVAEEGELAVADAGTARFEIVGTTAEWQETECHQVHSADIKRDEEEHGGGCPVLDEECNKIEFTLMDSSSCFISYSNDISDATVAKTDLEKPSDESRHTDKANPLQSTPSTGQPLVLVTAEEGKTCQSEPSAPAFIPDATPSVPQTAVTPDEDKFLETTEDMEAREEEGEVNLEADEPSSKADLEELPGGDCTQILDCEKDQTHVYNDAGKSTPNIVSVTDKETLVVPNTVTTALQSEPTPSKIEDQEEEEEEGEYHSDSAVDEEEGEYHSDSADTEEVAVDSVHEESSKLHITHIDQNADIPDAVDGIGGGKLLSGVLLMADEDNPYRPTPAASAELPISAESDNKEDECQHKDSDDDKEHGGGHPVLHEECKKLEISTIDRMACFISYSKDISDEIVAKTGVEQLTGELSDVANPLQSTPSTGQSLVLATTEEGKTCQSEPSPPAVILEVTQSVPQTAFTPDEDKVLEIKEDMEAREEEGEVNLEADEPSSKADLEQLPVEDFTQILDDGRAASPATSCVVEEEVPGVVSTDFEFVHTPTECEEIEAGCSRKYSVDINRDEKKDEDDSDPVAEESTKSVVKQIDESTWVITSRSGKIVVEF